ncbi:MAG: OmpA family protein [Haliea sp.]|uniref:OmpA family protein n=1 Tax=Haliea sp. TaxID=1932666 RepID=UPI0032EFD806
MMQRHLISTIFTAVAFAGATQASSADIVCDEGKRYYGLARDAGSSGDFGQAAEWLRKSVAACDSYAAWHLLGAAYLRQRDLQESLAAYEQAVVHASTQDQAAVSMARYGTVLALAGQRFEALSMLERAVAAHSNPPSWIRESARDLDLSLSETPISSDSIKRSLASQEFGLLAMSQIENKGNAARTNRAMIRIPINFKLDSVEMDDLTGGNIEELGSVLASKEYEGRTFTLEGHTDIRGAWDHNLTLSERRAETARDILEAKFPELSGRLRVVGAGEARPKYPGESLPESDHRLNRRLEVFVN